MPAKPDGAGPSRKKRPLKRFEPTQAQIDEMLEAFRLFDSEEKGFMPVKELKIAIRALGFEPRKHEIRKLLQDIDKENADNINFEEFCDIIMIKMEDSSTKDEILRAFRLFDDDETGKISFKNLKRVAQELGENLNDEELQAMLDEGDLDGDGEINEAEFLRIMENTNLY